MNKEDKINEYIEEFEKFRQLNLWNSISKTQYERLKDFLRFTLTAHAAFIEGEFLNQKANAHDQAVRDNLLADLRRQVERIKIVVDQEKTTYEFLTYRNEILDDVLLLLTNPKGK